MRLLLAMRAVLCCFVEIFVFCMFVKCSFNFMYCPWWPLTLSTVSTIVTTRCLVRNNNTNFIPYFCYDNHTLCMPNFCMFILLCDSHVECNKTSMTICWCNSYCSRRCSLLIHIIIRYRSCWAIGNCWFDSLSIPQLKNNRNISKNTLMTRTQK